MPELPEVESIKLQLQKYLVGHTIRSVEIRNTKYAIRDTDVVGEKIKDIRRFAKVLSIDLSNSYSIVVHLKLTGQLIYRGPNLKKVPNLSSKVVGGLPGKHTHIIFKLDHDGKFYYNDVRLFGWIRVIRTDEIEKTDFIGKLGQEPFKDLTLNKFKNIASKSSRSIKTLLMDQEKIGGVGNIYANDALWLARVHPGKLSRQLSDEEVRRLYDAIEEVLRQGLKYGGARGLAYVTPDGREGNYQDHTLVYDQKGTPCKRCKSKIKKIKLSGRGTYFCPKCQN